MWEFFRPSYFNWQQEPSWLFRHNIPRGKFTKQSGQQIWNIFEVSFETGNICNFVSCYFLSPTRSLFNFIAHSLFNCFAHIYLNTFIDFILVVRFLLTIILTPILFLLNKYTGTIDGNVENIFKMCSALFRICCTFPWFFMTTINIFSYVLVYGTYLFCLRIVYI